MASRNGRAIRFHESNVRQMGRVSTGVRGMKLDGADDAIVGMICMEPGSENNVMTISEKGFGKRSLLEYYPVRNRGGKGVLTMKVTDKTGSLVALMNVNDDNDLVIINKSGITLRLHVADVRVMGRATQGVRLINLDKRNDEIASVCCVAADEEAETEVIEAVQEELPLTPDEMLDDDNLEPDDEENDDANEQTEE